jgi:hypothetical protein
MATITVRRLDPVTWEPAMGNGQSCFISDIMAVGQIIAQRLKFFQGEWWANLTEGLPLFQSILGSPGSQKNLQIVTGLISAQIAGSPYVTGVSAVAVSYQARRLQFTATAQTPFGPVYLSNLPAISAVVT